AIAAKRPGLLNRMRVIFHQDNARLHVTQNVQKELHEFGWEILSHPSYSVDTDPSDCHLFHALQQFLVGKIRNSIEKYFNEKSKKFYSEDMIASPKRRGKFVKR
ncbi:Histone-lysine N-methyltransferase SETMAR, partial [Habropoda laboriosa]